MPKRGRKTLYPQKDKRTKTKYEIEDFVKLISRDGKLFFEVKWFNYDDSENTLENVNFYNETLLADYIPDFQIEFPSHLNNGKSQVEPTTSSRRVYSIEAFRGIRLIDGIFYFNIKWVGYPESQNTWEPKSNLHKGALDFLPEFTFEMKDDLVIRFDKTEKPAELTDEFLQTCISQKNGFNQNRKVLGKMICLDNLIFSNQIRLTKTKINTTFWENGDSTKEKTKKITVYQPSQEKLFSYKSKIGSMNENINQFCLKFKNILDELDKNPKSLDETRGIFENLKIETISI